MTKNTAVIDTNTGQYGLLNYYGYALFFYHTLSAWSGQTVHLPRRFLQFAPHHSAFSAAAAADGGGDGGGGGAGGSTGSEGTATLPILLAGE